MHSEGSESGHAISSTDAKDPTRSQPSSENVTSWSYDMQGHAEKREERYCDLETKNISSLPLLATPCIDDLSLPLEDFEPKRQLSDVCGQVVLKCVYLATIFRHPDVQCSVYIIRRSEIKWCQACDKKLHKLIF